MSTLTRRGTHRVANDDVDNGILDLSWESWHFCFEDRRPLLISDKLSVLSAMVEYFGRRSFMRHHAQMLCNYVLDKTVSSKQDGRKLTVGVVPLALLSHDANVISNHTV